jgi:predicted nucleic acid-binding protein
MIVLDANILIRAVLGRRVRQLIDTYAGQGVRFFAPDVAFDDAEKYLPPLLKKRGKPHADFSASLEYLRNIIETVTPELYAVFESEARQRLRSRDGSDWPIVATALDWQVQCGPKIRISSAPASRCGLQVESRFFSRDKHSRLNLRMNDVEGRKDLSMEQLRSYAVEGLVARCVRCG